MNLAKNNLNLIKQFTLQNNLKNFTSRVLSICMNELIKKSKINLSQRSKKYKKPKKSMNSTHSPSRLRLISLLIPPSNDPLLTPYQKKINPKILPLKRSFSILSNIRESPKVKQQKLQLSQKDYQKINRSYHSLKRFKKTYCKYSENEEEKQSDPRYLNLVQIRKSILIKKNNEKSMLFHLKTAYQLDGKQSSFITQEESYEKPKSKPSKNKSTNIEKQIYFEEQKGVQSHARYDRALLEQKQSPKSTKYFQRR